MLARRQSGRDRVDGNHPRALLRAVYVEPSVTDGRYTTEEGALKVLSILILFLDHGKRDG